MDTEGKSHGSLSRRLHRRKRSSPFFHVTLSGMMNTIQIPLNQLGVQIGKARTQTHTRLYTVPSTTMNSPQNHLARHIFNCAVLIAVTMFCANVHAQTKLTILTLDKFEGSAFLKKHMVSTKQNWSLKSGGTNYSYTFVDPEDGNQKIGVELSSNALFLTRIGISFPGSSLRETGRLTPKRERFLRELLDSTYSDIGAEALVQLVKTEQTKQYVGGSDQMPRVRLGNSEVFVGTTGADLIVGLLR